MSINDMRIRDEQPDDRAGISEVTAKAFATLEISNQTEHLIVEALRAAQALAVSLVAELGGSVVGHIAFSPVTLSDGTRDWYGLGPVSVHPDHQRRGIGKQLVEEGLSRLAALGARGCCLVGHPEYYRQFGFENTEQLSYEGVPGAYFFVLAFDGRVPDGEVRFHEAFQANSEAGASDGAASPSR
jgi:putative acetyltransferase